MRRPCPHGVDCGQRPRCRAGVSMLLATFLIAGGCRDAGGIGGMTGNYGSGTGATIIVEADGSVSFISPGGTRGPKGGAAKRVGENPSRFLVTDGDNGPLDGAVLTIQPGGNGLFVQPGSDPQARQAGGFYLKK